MKKTKLILVINLALAFTFLLTHLLFAQTEGMNPAEKLSSGWQDLTQGSKSLGRVEDTEIGLPLVKPAVKTRNIGIGNFLDKTISGILKIATFFIPDYNPRPPRHGSEEIGGITVRPMGIVDFYRGEDKEAKTIAV